ncbi:MAG TPA: hypothetical protein VHR47_02000 [Bacillota bacterium]|nr:hypothetical protein [Bacillota bacterium]
MREYIFHATPGIDDDLIKALDSMALDEQEITLRKALALYLKSIGSKKKTSRPTRRSGRPEPQGYPVE